LRKRVKQLYRANPSYAHHPDQFGEVQEFNASRLVKVTAEIVSRRDDGRVVRKRESLESLISILTPFNTGESHDIVYAVLSLAKDVSAGPPSVNLKTELTIEQLLPEHRIGCKLHSPEMENTKFGAWIIVVGIMTAITIAAFVCMGSSGVLTLTSLDMNHMLSDIAHHDNTYLFMVFSTLFLGFKLLDTSINRLFHGIKKISVVTIVTTLVNAVAKKLFNRRETEMGDDASSSGDMSIIKSHCPCERKRRILNNVMRRLRLEKFPVDYNKSFAVVCDDLYTFASVQSLSLDLIFRPWCPKAPNPIPLSDKEEKWLPTWIRPLEDRPFKFDPTANEMVRVNADTLVGTPGQSPYQASGRFRTGWKFGKHADKVTQILTARGFKLDTLESLSDPAEGGVIPRGWLKNYRRFSGGEYSSSQTTDQQASQNAVSTQFWRTMVAGKGPNGQNPPLSYSLVCQELFDSDDAINLTSKRDRDANEVLQEFLERALSVVWGRKLGKTLKLERLALLPYGTKETDIICILYGCSVPVVLRPVGDTSSSEELWELIGECYVYEMMAGEALAMRQKRFSGDSEFFRERDFVIR
jgi:hypothetical protein